MLKCRDTGLERRQVSRHLHLQVCQVELWGTSSSGLTVRDDGTSDEVDGER